MSKVSWNCLFDRRKQHLKKTFLSPWCQWHSRVWLECEFFALANIIAKYLRKISSQNIPHHRKISLIIAKLPSSSQNFYIISKYLSSSQKYPLSLQNTPYYHKISFIIAKYPSSLQNITHHRKISLITAKIPHICKIALISAKYP